jgi:hypothetical protein
MAAAYVQHLEPLVTSRVVFAADVFLNDCSAARVLPPESRQTLAFAEELLVAAVSAHAIEDAPLAGRYVSGMQRAAVSIEGISRPRLMLRRLYPCCCVEVHWRISAGDYRRPATSASTAKVDGAVRALWLSM